jgi:hypothetical protein
LAEKAATASTSYGLASDEDLWREAIEEVRETNPEGEPRELWMRIARSVRTAEAGDID